MSSRRLFRFDRAFVPALLVAVAAMLAGCSAFGYRLGSTLPPGIKTVHVPTFINRAGEPQLDTLATRATVEELQKDGVLKVAATDSADSILLVTLTDVVLEPLRYGRQEIKTTEEYRIRLLAVVGFKKARTGEPLLDGVKVEGKATFDFIGDMASSKRRAMPEAARDLARQVVRTVQEYW